VDKDTLTAVAEAILLTASGPVTVSAVTEAIDDRKVGEEEVAAIFVAIGENFERPGSGLRLEKVAGGWRCTTPPTLDPYLRSFHGIAARQRLSQAAPGLSKFSPMASKTAATSSSPTLRSSIASVTADCCGWPEGRRSLESRFSTGPRRNFWSTSVSNGPRTFPIRKTW